MRDFNAKIKVETTIDLSARIAGSDACSILNSMELLDELLVQKGASKAVGLAEPQHCTEGRDRLNQIG